MGKLRRSFIWEFWDKAKIESEALLEFEKELKRERGGFAESTIQATKWLIKFHPERLPEWYRNHPGLEGHINGKAAEA